MIRRSARATLALAIFVSCVGSYAPAANADERLRVRLTFASCPTLAFDRVRNILDAELGGAILPEGDATTLASVEVTLACDESVATIVVIDAAQEWQLERHVALDEVHPIARERFVAIAIAELMTDLGSEPDPDSPPPVVEPEPLREDPAPVAVPRAPAWRLTGTLLALGTTLGHPLREELGGGARFDAHRGRFGIATSLAGARARIHTPLGDVTAGELTLAFEALILRRRRSFDLAGALGARVGWARMRGRTPDPADIWDAAFLAPLFAPHVGVRAFFRPSARVSILLGADAAYVVLASHALADGVRVVGFQGPTLTVHAGVGFDLTSWRHEE